MARKKNAAQKKKIRSLDSVKPPHRPGGHSGCETSDSGNPSKPPGNHLEPGLYLVATPIGNASDVSFRALDVIKNSDIVACEDTRTSARLLAIHSISAKLVPYHEHNAEKARPAIIKRLKNGETVALISDAGTPLISDPGYKLVRACIEEGVCITTVPGPSAILAALVLSGLPTDRFMFTGFLPSRAAGRRRALSELASVPATLVFMESPRRLAKSLDDMAGILGNREAVVARELTKLFEEVRRGPLKELAEHYLTAGPPKGEVTVVVAPGRERTAPDQDEVDRRIVKALENLSLRDAVAEVAATTGLARQKVYARALEIKRNMK